MASLNKEKIAYYSSLSLLLSYAELLIPRFLPFLRFGLANSIILLALDFPFKDFFVLLIFKSLAASFISGTLFSPFFLISFLQSLASGLLMYVMKRQIKDFFSIYGISIAGAGVSALVQVFLAALYIGNQVYYVLWIMLLFSILSGFITALISEKLIINKNPPEIIINCIKNNTNHPQKSIFLSIFSVILIIIFTFITKNLILLSLMLVTGFVFQALCKRKIYILPHLSLWIFIVTLSLFSGEGKIIFQSTFITIYEDSLIDAISKALKLSIVMAVSQGAASLKPDSDSILSLILLYFSSLAESFNMQKGNLITKINASLNQKSLIINEGDKSQKKNIQALFIAEALVFALLFFCSFYIRKFK